MTAHPFQVGARVVDAQIELLSRLLQPIELDFHGERLRLQILLTAEGIDALTAVAVAAPMNAILALYWKA